MSKVNEEFKSIEDEIRWIDLSKDTNWQKHRSWNVYDILVPTGCLVTAGILANGIYNMYKRDSKKQQQMMRYRVLAQGITLLIAVASTFHYKVKSN